MRRLPFAVVATVVLAACGGTDMGVKSRGAIDGGARPETTSPSGPDITDPSASTVAPTSTTVAPTSTTVAPTSTGDEVGPVVTLVDAGAEPRQLLRFHPEPGLVLEQTMVMDQEITIELAGDEQTVAAGSTVVNRYTVRSVSAGIATIDSVYVSASSPDPATDAALAEIDGTTARMTVDDRGRILSSETDLGSESSPQTRQLVETLLASAEQYAFVLPEEEVGVGARWRIDADFGASGIPLMMSQEITITAIDGDVVSYDIDGTFANGDEEVRLPGMPAGASVEELTTSGGVTGTASLSLRSLYPDTTLESDVTMTLVAVEDTDRIEVSMRLVQRVDSSVRTL